MMKYTEGFLICQQHKSSLHFRSNHCQITHGIPLHEFWSKHTGSHPPPNWEHTCGLQSCQISKSLSFPTQNPHHPQVDKLENAAQESPKLEFGVPRTKRWGFSHNWMHLTSFSVFFAFLKKSKFSGVRRALCTELHCFSGTQGSVKFPPSWQRTKWHLVSIFRPLLRSKSCLGCPGPWEPAGLAGWLPKWPPRAFFCHCECAPIFHNKACAIPPVLEKRREYIVNFPFPDPPELREAFIVRMTDCSFHYPNCEDLFQVQEFLFQLCCGTHSREYVIWILKQLFWNCFSISPSTQSNSDKHRSPPSIWFQMELNPLCVVKNFFWVFVTPSRNNVWWRWQFFKW